MSSDLITVLSEDHRAVEQVFDELQSRQGGPAQRSALVQHVIIALVRHAVTEQRYLYPLVRQELPDGDARADREVSEHAEAERVMADLDAVDPDDHRFEALLAELVGQVRNHIEEEEHELFLRLTQAVPGDVLRELGDNVRRLMTAEPATDEQALHSGKGTVDTVREALG
ncbi:MAG: hemerythrin domain-containing protein [Pseudonocardiaceae bacterium]|nr:hemerythrin domain-containing protein [Pseudonocardiaceae bacterium]